MQAIRFQSSRKTNGLGREYLEALARVIAKVRDEKARDGNDAHAGR